MEEIILVNSLNELPHAAQKLLAFAGNEHVFLFYGEMAAGKTTIIKAICRELGVSEMANSPTFSIVNEYDGKDSKIYHFDFYRIENEVEAIDIGFDEYVYSGNYCFIEWPEKIEKLLPPDSLRMKISAAGEKRTLQSFE